ncbi:sialidase family protein [Promicromonospora aerolata]|uniref:exo-alpha-sialidase n=1 Tax=Promicromonospora aerolata TaxID=195749 RepID=A0ABW4V3J1_9MICO
MNGHLRRPASRVAVTAGALALLLGMSGTAIAATQHPAAPRPTTPAHHSTAAPDYDVAPPAGGPGTYVEQQLATNGESGFPNYRIPALTVTNSGDVLASYDGRPTAADSPGPNSILQRRSTDNGTTWGPQEVVAAGKTTTPIEGYSDPSYIVDRETGDIFNFHVKSYDAGFGGSRPGVDPADRGVIQADVSTSTDEGRTWTHRTITADVTADLDWRSRFAASGQGIQLKYGPHAGRLLQQYTIINGAGVFQAVSVYSDDHGTTWQVGEPVGTGMDENKTVELSDGRIMLNSRDSARSGYRKVAYSADGGVTYGRVTIDRELPDPTNNASIVRAYPNAPRGSAEARVLLFSNAASTTSRSNGTVRVSYDDGRTWPVSRVFQPGGMAYSTLATLPDGKVGLLYEPDSGYGGIRFATFDLDWLLNGG